MRNLVVIGMGVLTAWASWAAGELPLRQVAGRFQVTLRPPADGLFAREEMQIEFRVEDLSRPDPLGGHTAIVRAAIVTTIDMPEMPGMPPIVETAHAEGVPGDYGVHPTFVHGGEFRMRIAVRPPVGNAFEVVFPLRVNDAEPSGKRKPLPSRFTVALTTEPKRPRAGQPAELRFRILDRDNGNAPVTQFETVHEMPMHLIVVRKDLGLFAHEHPVFGAGGEFRLSYTFPAGGEYQTFVDLAPRGAGSQVLSAKLKVDGPEGPRFDLKSAWSTRNHDSRQVGSSTVDVPPGTPALPARKTSPVTFRIRDTASGQAPPDLQPYLGAAGHLMLVNEDAVTFVHSHPTETAAGPGELHFLARLPKPGLYRGWMQFRRADQVWTVDVLLRAEESQ